MSSEANSLESLELAPPSAMSAFAAYLYERESVQLLETDKGFATYIITGSECYIRDIWVLPEFRQKGTASGLADIVADRARKAGCTLLTGSVCPSTKHSTDSLKVLLAYGMTLHSAETNLIWFSKSL